MSYDSIVIGAGHNGLACACHLAKAGMKVLVLERYDRIGGMSVTEEIAAPGFHSDRHASGYLVAKLGAAHGELELERHGLELITPDPNWAQVFPDGRSLLIWRDVERTADSIATFSRRDAATWRGLYGRYLAQKEAIVAGLNNPPAEHGAGHGGADFRFRMQSARSWAEETFESPEIQAFMGSAALHAALAPDDALGGRFSWLFVCAVQDVGVSLVKGGMGHLPEALATVLRVHGGEIRTGARVERIETDGDRATAVILEGGERIAVDGILAASCDPRHLALDLLGEVAIGRELATGARRYDWGASFLGIYAALDRPLAYRAAREVAGAGYVHASHASMDALARSFVDIRAGLLPVEPMLGIINEAGMDPSRAPAGKGLVKLVAHFVPYRLRGDAAGRIAASDWDEAKDSYADAIIDWVSEAFIPDLAQRITARSVQSPVDYERHTSSAVHGTHQHGAFLPWQEGPFRPFPGFTGYRSPVPNVYLCGASSHPGSGISMAPGRNAARLIAGDLGIPMAGN